MPFFAAAAPVVAGGAAATAASTITALQVLGAIGLAVGAAVVVNALVDEPKFRQIEQDPLDSQQLTTREAAKPREFVYGSKTKGGQLAFLEVAGEENKELWYVIVYAGHRIDQWQRLELDDRVVDLQTQVDGNGDITIPELTDSDGNRLARVFTYDGTDNQQADPELMAAFPSLWTSDHRLRGLPYLVLRLLRDDSVPAAAQSDERRVWPTGAPQTIKGGFRGKRVYNPDPAAGQDLNDPATWTWSDNVVLCTADYLRDPDGYAMPVDSINWDAIAGGLADVCDELVTVYAGTGDGSTTAQQKRYTFDGVLSTETIPQKNLETLLATMLGGYRIDDGLFTPLPGRAEAPVAAFDESNMAGGMTWAPYAARRELYNAVRGTFTDATQSNANTDFSPRTSAAYEADDNVGRRWKDLTLNGVTNEQRAQRLAVVEHQLSRRQGALEVELAPEGMKLRPWDTFTLSNARRGWVDKLFRVVSIGWRPVLEGAILAGFSVNVQAIELEVDDYEAPLASLTDVGPRLELDPVDRRPSPVSNVVSTPGTEGPLLTWSNPIESGTVIIDLYRAEDVNDRNAAVRIAELLDEQYLDGNTVPGRLYYYWWRVRSVTGGTSSWEPFGQTDGVLGTREWIGLIADPGFDSSEPQLLHVTLGSQHWRYLGQRDQEIVAGGGSGSSNALVMRAPEASGAGILQVIENEKLFPFVSGRLQLELRVKNPDSINNIEFRVIGYETSERGGASLFLGNPAIGITPFSDFRIVRITLDVDTDFGMNWAALQLTVLWSGGSNLGDVTFDHVQVYAVGDPTAMTFDEAAP